MHFTTIFRIYVLLIIIITTFPCFASNSYKTWTTSSMKKVFRESVPPEDISKSEDLKLYAARNEYVAGQVVIRAGENKLSGVTVSISDLTTQSGNTIESEQFSLHKVAYVFLKAHNKYYPDPLPPLTERFNIKAGETQPIWIACVIPKTAKSGVYEGSVTISVKGQSDRKIHFHLEVWNFALPDDPILRNSFSSSFFPSELEGVKSGSDERKAMVVRYFEYLLERRISPNSLPYPLDSPSAVKYLSDPRLSSIKFPRNSWRNSALIDYLEENGWLAKSYVRIIDEPTKKERYDRIQSYGKTIDKVHPDLKQLVCFNKGANVGGRTFWDWSGDNVQIWCPITLWFSSPKVRAEATRRAQQGDEIWSYVCCDIAPYTNFLIDGADVETRITFWMLWKYRITGFLYWGTTSWKNGNPWITPNNNPSHPKRYGGGVLLYPGKPIGVLGPVTSIRLENIRDGIEDYQYLYLFAKMSGTKKNSDKRVDKIIKTLKSYNHNPFELEKVRNKIGKLLSCEGCQGK